MWKAAAAGAVAGTLPDLDSFIDHGDPIRNMTFHRGESHALFYLTLLAPAVALAASRIFREPERFRRWWLAMWLVLITHPLLDVMTVYGTQLGLPFTNHPYGVGSVFIIDPLYTLPLLIGTGIALSRVDGTRLRWNAIGLAASTLYLGWSVLAQQHVKSVAQESLQAQSIAAERLLVTPTAFNTLLWRVVAVGADGYYEGFYSVLDSQRSVQFDRFPRGDDVHARWRDDWHVARMAWFTHGFFRMDERDGDAFITDLRMGQEPYYTFRFRVGRTEDGKPVAQAPVRIGSRPDIERLLPWLWPRMLGETLPPPR